MVTFAETRLLRCTGKGEMEYWVAENVCFYSAVACATATPACLVERESVVSFPLARPTVDARRIFNGGREVSGEARRSAFYKQ